MPTKTQRPWWTRTDVARTWLQEQSGSAKFDAIAIKALRDGTCAYTVDLSTGRLLVPVSEFTSQLASLGLTMFFRTTVVDAMQEDAGAGDAEIVDALTLYASADTGVYLRLFHRAAHDDGSVQGASIEWMTTSAETHAALSAHTQASIAPVQEAKLSPTLYGIIFDGVYKIRPIGHVTAPLIRTNYVPSLVKDYDYICGELSADAPKGRLVMLEGAPGTGKTFMIRALVTDLVNDAKCIVIPPHIVADLSAPSLLPALLGARDLGMPMVLILEDADECMIDREKNGNVKNLASLLNLSDGLVGSALDLRVVATTNRRIAHVDKALLRPGRLIRRMHAGPLDDTTARGVFQRLTGRAATWNGRTRRTLAEVYELAQQGGIHHHK